jgi:hypothetical protein
LINCDLNSHILSIWPHLTLKFKIHFFHQISFVYLFENVSLHVVVIAMSFRKQKFISTAKIKPKTTQKTILAKAQMYWKLDFFVFHQNFWKEILQKLVKESSKTSICFTALCSIWNQFYTPQSQPPPPPHKYQIKTQNRLQNFPLNEGLKRLPFQNL